jgi:hypothetical protein
MVIVVCLCQRIQVTPQTNHGRFDLIHGSRFAAIVGYTNKTGPFLIAFVQVTVMTTPEWIAVQALPSYAKHIEANTFRKVQIQDDEVR